MGDLGSWEKLRAWFFVFDLFRFVVSVRSFGFVVFYLPSSSLLICICFFFYSLSSLLHLVLGSLHLVCVCCFCLLHCYFFEFCSLWKLSL